MCSLIAIYGRNLQVRKRAALLYFMAAIVCILLRCHNIARRLAVAHSPASCGLVQDCSSL